MNHDLIQLRLIHVSDLHFGPQHRFQPPVPPDGQRPPARGYPRLSASLEADLASEDFREPPWRGAQTPLLVAVSGDLTQAATVAEFQQSTEFINAIRESELLGVRPASTDILVVPGNHDVVFAEGDAGRRWHPFCEFHEIHSGRAVRPADAHRLSRVIDRSAKDRLILAEINTCFDVREGSVEADRGHVDAAAINAMRTQLEAIPPGRLVNSLKVAVMHHHPVVLPALAEPGRGYDAVVNAQSLLRLLQDFGFHLLLHGHKHYPHVFSYDATCAWTTNPWHPLVVVAGGSVGSVGLPDGRQPCNTYNVIALKWNADAQHGRVQIITRGLERFDDRGSPLEPERWHWKTLRVFDRNVAVASSVPKSASAIRAFDDQVDGPFEDARIAEYVRLRGNMAVCEVQPSLDPEQAYEVHLWLCAHPNPEHPREVPVRVTWAAGRPPKFTHVQVSDSRDDPRLAASFSYWGPMLVQARLEFADGSVELTTVYARVPGVSGP